MSRWGPPKPSDDASSLWPDGSPARRAASLYIFPSVGPGKPSSVALSLIARPATDGLTASSATAPASPPSPTRLPNRLKDSRQVGPRASLAAFCPDHLAQHHHRGPPTSPLRAYRTLHSAKSIGIKPSPLFLLPLIPCLTHMATSLRWIRN